MASKPGIRLLSFITLAVTVALYLELAPVPQQGLTLHFPCAVQRHGLSAGANPARQLSLQPVAIGAVAEVTKRLKPLV